MSARVVQLRPKPAKPKRMAVADRLSDRWGELRCQLKMNTIDRLPIVVVRRSKYHAEMRNAFELGQDFVRLTGTRAPLK